ncbi:MAG TPA: diacylglycerol kinase family protein [Propionibacteriaceae bacterium]|nr:diacylglycerol kinase family protein [Propionibacteriaceae bacterium]
MDSILLVTNVQAGTADEGLAAALDALRSDADVEVCRTSSADDLDNVLRRRQSRILVVAGGDGSLHSAVEALNRRDELEAVVLGLIPLGTGNDFARGIGIPLDPAAAARVVLQGRAGKVDLILDSVGGVVVNNVHAGVGVEASRRAAKWKQRVGRAGYVLGLLHAAFRAPYLRVRVEVDGTVIADGDRPVLEVSVGNGATVGGGLPLNPAADPQSGRLDVMVSFAVGSVERVGYGVDILRSRHTERPDAVHRRARTVTIAGEPFHCSADGEIQGPEQGRTWTIAPSALEMVLPTPQQRPDG